MCHMIQLIQCANVIKEINPSILISNYINVNGSQNGVRYNKIITDEINETWTNETYREELGLGSVRILIGRRDTKTEIKNLRWKVELGTTATPYTVAPEDLFPSLNTFTSFPEWPDEDNEERA